MLRLRSIHILVLEELNKVGLIMTNPIVYIWVLDTIIDVQENETHPMRSRSRFPARNPSRTRLRARARGRQDELRYLVELDEVDQIASALQALSAEV